jgi:hypothetical protein
MKVLPAQHISAWTPGGRGGRGEGEGRGTGGGGGEARNTMTEKQLMLRKMQGKQSKKSKKES